MQSSESWKQFESTGRIEDYLFYKSLQLADNVRNDIQRDKDKCIQQGDKPYAGIIKCDGNGTKADAYR